MVERCHGLMAGTAYAVGPLATVLFCLLVVMPPRCAGEHGAARRRRRRRRRGGGAAGAVPWAWWGRRGRGAPRSETVRLPSPGFGALRGRRGGRVLCPPRVCMLRVGVWETGFGIPLTCCESASESEVQVGNRGKQRCLISGRDLKGSNMTEARMLLSGVFTVPLWQGWGRKAALALLFSVPALWFVHSFQVTTQGCQRCATCSYFN